MKTCLVKSIMLIVSISIIGKTKDTSNDIIQSLNSNFFYGVISPDGSEKHYSSMKPKWFFSESERGIMFVGGIISNRNGAEGQDSERIDLSKTSVVQVHSEKGELGIRFQGLREGAITSLTDYSTVDTYMVDSHKSVPYIIFRGGTSTINIQYTIKAIKEYQAFLGNK